MGVFCTIFYGDYSGSKKEGANIYYLADISTSDQPRGLVVRVSDY